MANKLMSWVYVGDTPRREYIDPRLPVARQIGWSKLPGDTPWTVPEPDNYNRAIVTDKPVECRFVEDQVIYKNTIKNYWITLMLVPDEKLAEYDLWLARTKLRAFWQHTKPPKLKQQRRSD